jgi:TRAP-type C4-dicarboxylate transport system permease small subunit
MVSGPKQVSSLVIATSRVFARLVARLCVIIIYVMLGLLVTQVLMRYFLGAPPSWTEELAVILFAWLVLLYATVGLRERSHVAIEIVSLQRGWLFLASERLVAGLVFGFGFVALSAGLSYIARTSGQMTAALQLPIEVLYLSVPVCGGLLMLHAAAMFLDPCAMQEDVARLAGLDGTDVP